MLGRLASLAALKRGLSRRLAYVVPFLVLLGAVVLRIADPSGLVQLRNYAFDNFQRFSPRPWAADILPVRIVDIDEASLREVGQWPWPRTIVANLVDRLTEAEAAVIAFDAIFAEPDRTSPQHTLASLEAFLDRPTLDRLRRTVGDNDQILAEAIERSGRVVLGFARDPEGVQQPPKRVHNIAYVGDDARVFLQHSPAGSIRNLPMLEDMAAGMGSIMTDIGDVIRYVPMFSMVPGSEVPYPALSLEALRVLLGSKTYLIKASNASDTRSFGLQSGISSVLVRGAPEKQLPTPEPLVFPTKRDGSVQLYDTGHKKARFVSAADVLNRKVDADKLAGHIILIGSSAAGLKDLRNTPIDSAVPGVEVHAQIIEQILLQWLGSIYLSVPDAPAVLKQMVAHSYIYRPDYADGAELVYLIVVGAVVLFLLPRVRARWMAAIGILGTGLALVVPWLLFEFEGSLFDPIYPAGTVALMYVVGSAFSFIQTELDRAQIRNAFGMYLAPALVEQLARNPERLQLGGETRELTVMFTDVRGFTTISEQFDAQGLTRFMNRMLTPMTDIILEHHGTIDKYMGDAIMAFWNAPLDEAEHARRACAASLEMQRRLKELNVEWQAEAEREGRRYIEVRIGVGLNSGPASVGNFGSTQRFTYSALGDDVNLASRLEGQCKTYAVEIIVGNKTRAAAPEFAAIEIDLIMVKGKTTPERIFTLLGPPDLTTTADFTALVEAQDRFLQAYRDGRFGDAIAASDDAETIAGRLGWQQGYYAMMRERCEELIAEPPTAWAGVYVAKDK